jgi:hypothetical protein
MLSTRVGVCVVRLIIAPEVCVRCGIATAISRKMTGHHIAAVQVAYYNITVRGEPKWYYVSDASAHGFCGDCGCQLFWRNDNNDYLSVTAGSLNDTSGLILKGHVFTSEKGGYYNIPKTDLQYSKFWDEDPS